MGVNELNRLSDFRAEDRVVGARVFLCVCVCACVCVCVRACVGVKRRTADRGTGGR